MSRLYNILNAIASRVFGDLATVNETDTWIPVVVDDGTGRKFQHRVLPSYGEIQATKSGSYWTNGNIYVYRQEHTIWMKFNGVSTNNSSRQTIATIPEGYRPPRETYSNGGSFGVTYDGTVWADTNRSNAYDVAIYITTH